PNHKPNDGRQGVRSLHGLLKAYVHFFPSKDDHHPYPHGQGSRIKYNKSWSGFTALHRIKSGPLELWYDSHSKRRTRRNIAQPWHEQRLVRALGPLIARAGDRRLRRSELSLLTPTQWSAPE